MLTSEITLYLTEARAMEAGRFAILKYNEVYDFAITHGEVRWADGSSDRGWKVSLRNERNAHIGFL